MKRHIGFLIIAMSAHILSAQTSSDSNGEYEDRMTYLHCDFNNGIPSDFATYDRDGKTLHFSMTQAGLKKGESWVAVREPKTDPVNYYAGSGSKHKYEDGEEAAAADDWLISPQVWIKGNNAKLMWQGKSFGENKKTSSYNVYVSTTGNTPDDFKDAPIFTVEDESATDWTKHEVSLAQYNGQRIYVAFQNNSLDKEVLAIDNISLEGEKGLCELLVTTEEYVSGVNAVDINAKLTAYSDEEIKSFTAYYEYNGNVFTKEVSNISLKKHDSIDFTFDQQIAVEVGDTIRYKVWAEVNNITLDAIERSTISFLFMPKRKVVVEEGTGMWCVYCPKGIVAMEELKKKYPESFIGIAVHYDDILEVQDYRIAMDFPGFPSARVNRKYLSPDIMKQVFVDGEFAYSMLYGGLETLFLQGLEDQTHAEMSVIAQTDGDQVYVWVDTRFAIDIDEAKYQIAIALIENDVTGDKNDYYQDNGFSGSDIAVGGFENKPDRIHGFVFQEVARDIFDDYQGVPGSVPAKIVAGENNAFNYTFDIPENIISINNAEVIAMLIDMESGEILNADIKHVVKAGVEDAVSDKSLNLSHRIDNKTCFIDINTDSALPAQISLYSVNGVKLSNETVSVNGGKVSYPIDIDGLKGIYFVTVAQGNKSASLKIVF